MKIKSHFRSDAQPYTIVLCVLPGGEGRRVTDNTPLPNPYAFSMIELPGENDRIPPIQHRYSAHHRIKPQALG